MEYYDTPYGYAGIREEDVAEVVHQWSSADVYGWDGESVLMVLRMVDGRWGFLEGACDYTGWDCQADAEVVFASSEANLVPEMTAEARNLFGYTTPPDCGV